MKGEKAVYLSKCEQIVQKDTLKILVVVLSTDMTIVISENGIFFFSD